MNRRSILVVDDEEALRKSLAANLELEGYEVLEARSGAEAIEIVRASPVDLVLSDIRMPGLNGVDAFRAIRKLRPDLEVVMMTAFALERLVDEAVTEGAYTVVRKPFSMDHVIDVVSRAILRAVVLVVDAPENAASVAQELASLGLRAEVAHDEASARRLFGEHRADVCVLDLMTPGMDTVATYHELRALDPTVAIIGVAGYSAPELIHQLMSSGAYTCLRKPLNARDLVRAIARARGDPERR